MASSSYSSSSPLVVQQLDHHRNSLSYPLIDLPNDYYQSLWKLVDHIKSIIALERVLYMLRVGDTLLLTIHTHGIPSWFVSGGMHEENVDTKP